MHTSQVGQTDRLARNSQAPLARLLASRLFFAPGPQRTVTISGGLVLLSLALALAPLPLLALAIPLVLALLLAPLGPMYGLCLAILSVPVQEIVHLPGGLSYTQAAMVLAVAAWVMAWLTGHAALRTWHAFFPWLAFLWALVLATTLTPYSTSDALKETLRWAEAFVIWLLVISVARTPRQIAALIGCLLLAPVAEALLGLWQFATGAGPPSFRIAAGLPFVRAYGTIGQPNSFAGYVNMAWPLALALAFGASLAAWKRAPASTQRRWIGPAGLWLGAAVLLAGLLVSFSRGAWLGAVAGLVGMALALGGRARWATFGALALGALTLALGGAGLLPAALAGRLGSITSYLLPFDAGAVAITPANFAVVERMAQMQAGWRMLLAHPLSGVGPGNFSTAYPVFAVGQWYVSRGHAHNYYVHIAAETGIVGLTTYMLLLGTITRQATRTLRSVQAIIPRSIAIGCCGIIAAVVGHDMFENLHVLSMGIQLAAVWGLLGTLEVTEQRPQH